MPVKEGPLKTRSASFEDFVPAGQGNVLLLDDNLLMFDGVEELLREMIERRYAVNLSLRPLLPAARRNYLPLQ